MKNAARTWIALTGEFSNYRALHEAAAWFDVKETGRRHSELKRSAEAHTRTLLQRKHPSSHK